MAEIERFIRIQRRSSRGKTNWETIPLGERVQVWELSKADSEDAEKIFIFHIAFVENVQKGHRVVYLGEHLEIRSVSDSPKLLGLELHCRPQVSAP